MRVAEPRTCGLELSFFLLREVSWSKRTVVDGSPLLLLRIAYLNLSDVLTSQQLLTEQSVSILGQVR